MAPDSESAGAGVSATAEAASSPVPESHRCDHLILPVGGNPLPLAVVGPALVRDNGTITLLCSKASRDAAKAARDVLTRRLAPRGVTVRLPANLLNESDQGSIWKEAHAALEASHVAGNAAKPVIGVNYTPGTKAMAVHLREAVAVWCREKSYAPPQRSYLSARDGKVRFDAENPLAQAGRAQPAYSLRGVPVSLEEMLALHGLQRIPAPHYEAPLPEEVSRAARAVACHQREWASWRRGYLDGTAFIHDAPVAGGLRGAIQDLERFLQHIKDTKSPKKNQELDMWVRSDWLEDYTLDCLAEADRENGFGMTDLLRSLSAGSTSGGPAGFELDVVGVRGHQLFAVSCACETRLNASNEDGGGKVKWKLFEAITRARQIGGDEARVAMVTLLSGENRQGVPLTEQVRTEAHELLQREGQVVVFGRDDLPCLKERLAQWVREAYAG